MDRPALLRRLFDLGCRYSGQFPSCNKMLGQLQDAGNTTTLAHCLDLLGGAGLLTRLPKFSGSEVRRRGSSPKLHVLNMALMTAGTGPTQKELRSDTGRWGRLVESAVGAHLANAASTGECRVHWWRESNREVDYVVETGSGVTAIEVEGGRPRDTRSGTAAFAARYPATRLLLVGGDGISSEEFLGAPVAHPVGIRVPGRGRLRAEPRNGQESTMLGRGHTG